MGLCNMLQDDKKMNDTISIRVNDELRDKLRNFTESTGISLCQVARWGIETKLAEYERDGHITPTTAKPKKESK